MDAFAALESILPASARRTPEGRLEVGGVDLVSLASELGTPLYVYDAGHLEETCERYAKAFGSGTEPAGRVIYASKAFPAVAMMRIALECGLGIDVAGAGELHAALEAGAVGPEIYFHGNAKSPQEISMGIEACVGRFVVDNVDELYRLEEALRAAKERCGHPQRQQVLVRVTPGVEAHTHEFIKTGHIDSKFGFYLADGSAEAAIKEAAASSEIEPVGIHLHIGSQILELEPFAEAARIAIDFVDTIYRKHAILLTEVNFGGGLGATYTPGDEPPSIEEYAACLKQTVGELCEARNIPFPLIVVEPGRSITANAGLTLYTVQSVKTTPSGRTYVAVDGGMSDNLRPMLYGATYEALVANKLDEDHSLVATLAGKHCESGDVLIERASLASSIEAGDIVATPATGAYGWSMSSNYNGQPRPAVVFVDQGEARVVVRRESLDDLLRLQR